VLVGACGVLVVVDGAEVPSPLLMLLFWAPFWLRLFLDLLALVVAEPLLSP
jgi:hypothetical protein